MDLEDAGGTVRYLIRDRDGKYPACMTRFSPDAGITVVRSGVHVPPDEFDHGTVGTDLPS